MRIMRKSINILLSILLSILIVWIGSGIMTMVCEHTGNVSLAQQMEKKNCKNSDAKHCMKMQIKTLSPTNTAQTVTHQFHPVQLSLLPQLTTSCELLPLLTCKLFIQLPGTYPRPYGRAAPRKFGRFSVSIWTYVPLSPSSLTCLAPVVASE